MTATSPPELKQAIHLARSGQKEQAVAAACLWLLEELAGQVTAFVAQWAKAQLEADMDSLRARRDQADRECRERRDRQRVVNLRPLDVAHFKDRLREIQTLCGHLADAGVRLVSVVGRGGMGKTALVSRVLTEWATSSI